MTKAPTYKLLIDRPAIDDQFGSGSHRRVAASLASAVRQLANADGAIGLEGQWGAGKSSVIEFAAQKLEATSDDDGRKYHIFSFDLWAHGAEDIRRALKWLGWSAQHSSGL